MSVTNPAFTVTRWSVAGMEGMWTKMWDPPTVSPPPTDQLLLEAQGLIRPNPVPEVMFAAGLQGKPSVPHTVQRDLLHGLNMATWDNRPGGLNFFVIGDTDNPSANNGTYPGPTLRMPRSVIFHAAVSGKGPPPHTIHWHGLEPTPMNDGVGHTAMELGSYGYQWQPNFMGFYFLHCHRNTMQHFEFGLFSALIFEAPDAYFASIASTNPDGSVNLRTEVDSAGNLKYPIGHGRDGKRRVACNLFDPLTGLPKFAPGGSSSIQFPGFNSNPVDTPDPGPNLAAGDTNISFPTDPHAQTVPFDVEALLVCDDRDPVWSDLASNAFATFPKHGSQPGINDQFNLNPGKNGFFAFNDFNAGYWFITGVPVPAPLHGTAAIPPNLVIDPALNSGISGTQISVNAKTGDTILVRLLCAAYNTLKVTLPVDAVFIAWDGRALGVAPYAHNHSYLVPGGTEFDMAVGRRFDALIRSNVPVNDFITVKFINHNSQSTDAGETEEIVCTAKVPFTISGAVLPSTATFTLFGAVVDQLGTPVPGCTVTCTPKSAGGTATLTVLSDEFGKYTISSLSGIVVGDYQITASKTGKIIVPASQTVSLVNQDVTVPNIVVSIADFAPNSYSLPEALDSLREVVGLNPIPRPAFKSFRYDVAPLLPRPGDGIIDIRDSLNILRMVVGLNPV